MCVYTGSQLKPNNSWFVFTNNWMSSCCFLVWHYKYQIGWACSINITLLLSFVVLLQKRILVFQKLASSCLHPMCVHQCVDGVRLWNVGSAQTVVNTGAQRSGVCETEELEPVLKGCLVSVLTESGSVWYWIYHFKFTEHHMFCPIANFQLFAAHDSAEYII